MGQDAAYAQFNLAGMPTPGRGEMECKDESIDDMLNAERIALENDGVIRKKKNYYPNAF
jgi:hypothetical protein